MGEVLLRQTTIAIASTLNFLLTMYWWIVVAGVVLSWVSPDPYNPVVRFIRSVTEPVFYRARRLLPFLVIQGIDLSPIVILLGLEIVRTIVVTSLYDLSMRFAAAALGGPVG
jgi:YggT family protein